MKFWKKLFSIFKGLSNKPAPTKPPVVIKPQEPLPEVPSNEEVENFPANPGLRIALVRGHGGNDGGAEGNGTNEVAYNTFVMEYVAKHTKRNLKCFYGESSMGAVTKSLMFRPDITFQLHLNSYNGSAHGCEVLVIKGDTASYPLAEKFAKAFTEKFGRTLRRPENKGKKILESSDRGVSSLKASVFGIKILTEAFFIDNASDFVPKEEYAKFFLEFVESL